MESVMATGRRIKVFSGHGHWMRTSPVPMAPFRQWECRWHCGGNSFIKTHRKKYRSIKHKQIQTSSRPKAIQVSNRWREMVRLIYFRPSDRLPRQGIDKELDTLIRWTQYFYAEQMQDYDKKPLPLKPILWQRSSPSCYRQIH